MTSESLRTRSRALEQLALFAIAGRETGLDAKYGRRWRIDVLICWESDERSACPTLLM